MAFFPHSLYSFAQLLPVSKVDQVVCVIVHPSLSSVIRYPFITRQPTTADSRREDNESINHPSIFTARPTHAIDKSIDSMDPIQSNLPTVLYEYEISPTPVAPAAATSTAPAGMVGVDPKSDSIDC